MPLSSSPPRKAGLDDDSDDDLLNPSGNTALLSPRSKLQALLASVDSDDEDGSDSDGSTAKTSQDKIKFQPRPTLPAMSMSGDDDDEEAGNLGSDAFEVRLNIPESEPDRANDGDFDDDDGIFRPRGRFAQRMFQDSVREESAPEVIPNGTNENAREQVRKLFQLHSEPKGDPSEFLSASVGIDNEDEDDDEEPVSARKPRRSNRPRTPSPSPEDTSLNAEAQPRSPGLFLSPGPMSPSRQRSTLEAFSDDEDALPTGDALAKNPRFLALVQRKREERLAREKAEADAKQQSTDRGAELGEGDGEDADMEDEIAEGMEEADRRHTIHRSKKLNKKTMEEMHRETQRMQRSMQLAHDAKTRRKITTSTLFERFHFRTSKADDVAASVISSSTTTNQESNATNPASSPLRSNAELADAIPQTTASSPIRKPANASRPTVNGTTSLNNTRLPALRQIRAKLPLPDSVDLKQKIISFEEDSDDDLEVVSTTKNYQRTPHPKKLHKIDSILAKIPTRTSPESHVLHTLKQLAQIQSPTKSNGPARGRQHPKGTMTAAEMQITLQRQAREQARKEREDRLEALRARGIVVQSEQERIQQLEEVESMVARARDDAKRLRDQERAEAGEEGSDWDDSEEDADYSEKDAAADPEGAGDAVDEIALSGSEEEDEEDEDGEEEDGEEEDGEEEDDNGKEIIDENNDVLAPKDAKEDDEDDDHSSSLALRPSSRKVKSRTVPIDDEDDNEDSLPPLQATPRQNMTATSLQTPQQDGHAVSIQGTPPAAPSSVLRSASKPFIPGVPVVGPAGLGLTQMFAGTMDDSQMMDASQDDATAIRQPGPASFMSTMPDFSQIPLVDSQEDDMITDSQPAAHGPSFRDGSMMNSQALHLRFSQSQLHGLDSLARDEEEFSTQISDVQLTQDDGIQQTTPLKHRFVEAPSTLSIVSEPESPLANQSKKLGRLRRKADVLAKQSSTISNTPTEKENVENSTPLEKAIRDATSVTEHASSADKQIKKKQQKDKRDPVVLDENTKSIFDEQAEESDDEYAGLGGADGGDSDDDDSDAASMQEMIDDEGKVTADDERKLAAFYADRERAQDEKQVEKLFKDLTTGMLRRKRGAEYDLSDSGDDGEARRRMKRRQFAKMQQALFADERVKKIASNPGNQAFMRTIEDRDADGDDSDRGLIGLEDDHDGDGYGPFSHLQRTDSGASGDTDDQIVPDSQPQATSTDARKVVTGSGGARKQRFKKKPATLSEIRASLSSLLEEPSAFIPEDRDMRMDQDDEETSGPADSAYEEALEKETERLLGGVVNKENQRPTSGVVDRIQQKRTLSRTSSSSSSSSATAFSAGSSQGRRMPNLLRRATSNSVATSSAATGSASSFSSLSSMSAASSSSNTANAAPGANSSGNAATNNGRIGKTAAKSSGVNFFSRDHDRASGAAASEGDRRREAKKWQSAEQRVKAVGGLFGSGEFE